MSLHLTTDSGARGRTERHPRAETICVKSGPAPPIHRTVRLAGKILGKALLVLAIAVPQGAATADVELYRPKHRSADELARLIDPLLGEGGRAAADPGTGALLVSGGADARATARGLLAELDVPLVQYRVDSRIESREGLRLRALAPQGEFDLGPLRVARLRGPDRPAPAGVRFRELGTEALERREPILLVREGDTAELWIGSLVPIRVRDFELRDREERVLETEPQLALRTGLQLLPRALPEGGVELELWAVSAEPGAGGVSRTSGPARVRLEPGEWLALTQLSRTPVWGGTAPLGAEDGERDEVLLFRLRPAED